MTAAPRVDPAAEQQKALQALSVLSEMQLEVLVLFSKGYGSKQQAEHTGCTVAAMRDRARRALKKLDLTLYEACALIGKAGLS